MAKYVSGKFKNLQVGIKGYSEDKLALNIVGIVSAASYRGGGISATGTSLFNNLNVSGVSTFAGNINANGDIIGDNSTNIVGMRNVAANYINAMTGINAVGVSTFAGNINANGDIVGDTATNISGINDLYVAGVGTFISDLHVGGQIIATTVDSSFKGAAFTGNIFADANLSVDGHTELDDVNIGEDLYVAGISTFNGNINANGNIVGDNSTNITGIAGVTATTLTGTLQTAAQPNITSLGTLDSLNVTGNVSVGGTLTYEDVTNIDAVGLITARSGIHIPTNKTIGLGDTTSATIEYNSFGVMNRLNKHGATDFTWKLEDEGGPLHMEVKSGTTNSYVQLNQNGNNRLKTKDYGVEITGTTDTDQLNVSGVSTFVGDAKFQDTIFTDKIKRYSDSGTTTKIILNDENINLFAGDHTNETLNVTPFQVTIANSGNLNVTGVSTFQDDIFIGVGATVGFGTNAYFGGTKTNNDGPGIEIGPDSFKIHQTNNYSELISDDSIQLVSKYSGYASLRLSLGGFTAQNNSNRFLASNGDDIITTDSTTAFLHFSDSEKLKTTNDGVEIGTVGISTLGIVTATSFYGDGSNLVGVALSTILSDAGINTAGSSNFDNLYVSGISTFQSNIHLLDDSYLILGNSVDFVMGHTVGVNAITIGSTLHISDSSTNNRVVLSDNGILEVKDTSGTTKLEVNNSGINLSGVSTFAGNINANGNIIGDNATNISGINSVTATGFYGDGSNLTGINTSGDAGTWDEIDPASSSGLYNLRAGEFAAPTLGNQGNYSQNNIAIGHSAFGQNVYASSNNVIIGHESGYFTTGNKNTFVGYRAGKNSGQGGGNNTIIGADLDLPLIGGSNQFVIGCGSINIVGANSNIGIGTTNPQHKLHVVGDVKVTDTLFAKNTNFSGITTINHIHILQQLNHVTIGPGVSTFTGDLHVYGDLYPQGNVVGDSSTNISGVYDVQIENELNVLGDIVSSNSNIIGVNSVTATSFYGDGSALTGVISGVGIQTASGNVGFGITYLKFIGDGVGEITAPVTGISTINITGAATTTGNIIVPFAYAHIKVEAAGVGIGMTYGAYEGTYGRQEFYFNSAQPNSDYYILSEREQYDTHSVHISNKTTSGFRATWLDNSGTGPLSPSTFPGVLIAYGSDPKTAASIFDTGISTVGTQQFTNLDLSGFLNVSGISTFENNVHLLDNDKLQIGGSASNVDGLEIYHDSSDSYINDTGTGILVLQSNRLRVNSSSGGGTTILDVADGGIVVSGVVTATSYYGDGSNLTGVIASGTGIVIKDSGSAVGTASTIDFGTNLSVSALSAGIVTVTASGGGGGASGLWESNSTGINTSTNVAIGNTNASDAAFTIDVGTAVTAFNVVGSEGSLFSVTNNLSTGSIFSVNDISGIPSFDVDADGTVQIAPFGVNEKVGIGITNPQEKLHVVGVVSATSFYGDGSALSGIVAGVGTTSNVNTTGIITASGLNGDSLNITGISTLAGYIEFKNYSRTWPPNNWSSTTEGITVSTVSRNLIFQAGGTQTSRGFVSLLNNGGLWMSGGDSYATHIVGMTSVTGITTFASTVNVGGNLGIGTDDPKFKTHIVGSASTTLMVEGNARITGILTIGQSSITLDGSTRKLTGVDQVEIGQGVDKVTLKKTARGYLEFVDSNNRDAKVAIGTDTDIKTVGVVTATRFVGDGSGLTGITATGSGIGIKDSGSVVGTATTIDFGTNLNVSPVTAGIVTVSSTSFTTGKAIAMSMIFG